METSNMIPESNNGLMIRNEHLKDEARLIKKAKVRKFSASIIVDMDNPCSYQNIQKGVNKAALRGISNN